MKLTADEQQALFTLIREAIRAHLVGAPPPELPRGGEALSAPCGAFVTLRMRADRALRGCIGHTVSQRPLAETVRILAVSSAFEDSRFPPLTLSELDGVRAEVSVLSPLEPADTASIEVGKHGLMIRHRGRAGLLLPEVASDRGWTAEQFLRNTCLKAGLPPGSWAEQGAEVLWFTSEHYEEP